jgi:hypothetical protein
MIFPEPDEHDLSVRIHRREREGAHLRQGLHGVAMDLRDAPYGVARGKYTAKAGRNQHVAALNIRIAREVGERQRGVVVVTRSHGDRP